MSAAPADHLHVLSAEDQRLYAEMVSTLFTEAGHAVVTVENGREAQDIASMVRFDLLVTDYKMPQVDGLELVTRLKETGFTGKIIVHAGNLPLEIRAQFEELHVDEIVSKGSESDQLVSLAERLCRGAPRNFRDHASQ
jgi:CheY-like chemotaxis protein